MSKKTNPHRIPTTQADVRKARNEGIRIALVICMFVLRNYFGFGKTRLIRFWDHVTSMADEYGRGEFKLSELLEVLEREYGIVVD